MKARVGRVASRCRGPKRFKGEFAGEYKRIRSADSTAKKDLVRGELGGRGGEVRRFRLIVACRDC